MDLSQSEENYIKAIYSLYASNNELVSTNDLAEELNTKASSATEMIKKLAKKELAVYEKYKGVSLTSKGKETALKTIRKHRLWETFLVKNLGFGWDEVHDIAEQLEHIKSTSLTDKLEKYLGFPKFDPHGDPIPNKSGEFDKIRKTEKLSKIAVNNKVIVTGVSDASPAFLRYLDQLNINIGTKIFVSELIEFDGSMVITVNDKQINLSQKALENIKVQQIDDNE